MKSLFLIFSLSISFISANAWGFFAHKKINEHACYLLPAPLGEFYKYHLKTIVNKSVNPDKRRYAVANEAPKHYIDSEAYGDSSLYKLPLTWNKVQEQISLDTLLKHGTVPWTVQNVYHQLVWALREKNVNEIVRLSADLGHYVGDANVPLHTTCNYNGQLTNQVGIHGLWESRLPEIFFDKYEFWVGTATYEHNIPERTFLAVRVANVALDSVLTIEKQMRINAEESDLYAFEQRKNGLVKVFSKKYASQYHEQLNGMVERQMKLSVKMLADLWYSAWIDAGQPILPLTPLETEPETEVEPTPIPSIRDEANHQCPHHFNDVLQNTAIH